MRPRSHGFAALVSAGFLAGVLVAWNLPSGDPAGTSLGPPSAASPSTTRTAASTAPESGTTSDTSGQPPSAATTTGGSSEPSAGTGSDVVPGVRIEQCRRSGRSVPLTVVTFNIHSAMGREGFQIEQVAAEIAASDPDVVLLQEVDDGRLRSELVDEAAYLADALGMSHVFGSNVVRPGRRAGDPFSRYGTAVLTRLKVESSTHVRLPNRPGRQPRGLQHLVLRLGDRQISVYNAHLDHTTPGLRQQQMRRARDLIAADPRPVVFGGDFNASPGSPTMSVALDPARSDLVDPWPLVGDGSGLTVPNNSPRARIDYLLADDEWRPKVMATWQSAVSDHRGVVGKFALRSPRVCA